MSMNFKINVQGLLDGLAPAVVVATVGTVKDDASAYKVTMEATKDGLVVTANGGRVSLRTPISSLTHSGIQYSHISDGSATVAVNDLLNCIKSFNSKAELLFEIRSTANADGAAGEELVIVPVADKEQYQTLPIIIDPVVAVNEAKDFNKSLVIRRDVFVDGISRVQSAAGVEEHRPRYTYVVLRTKPDYVRFAAGTGMRFYVLDVEGTGVVKSDGPEDILIPKEQASTLIGLFTGLQCDYLTIKQSDNAGSAQMVFECDLIKITLTGFDPNVKWINENQMLNRANQYKFTTRISEWGEPIKGVIATNNDEAKKNSPVPKSTFTFDLEKQAIAVKSDRIMRAFRKINTSGQWAEADAPPQVGMYLVTALIAEVVKNGMPQDFVQVELTNNKEPVVVRYYSGEQPGTGDFSKVNLSLGLKERFVIFVAALNNADSIK